MVQCAQEERLKALRRDSEHLASAAKAHPASEGRKRLPCSSDRNKSPALQPVHVMILQTWTLFTILCL